MAPRPQLHPGSSLRCSAALSHQPPTIPSAPPNTGREYHLTCMREMNTNDWPALQLSAAAVAYPSLALTYLSQAAYLIHEPHDYATVFWSWVPGPVQWPMLILATAATIIASQALISASFSVVSQVTLHLLLAYHCDLHGSDHLPLHCLQAMKLGLFPTMTIKHTGAEHAGQIYISEVNFLLMAACVPVVGGFRDTVALGHAYGAVSVPSAQDFGCHHHVPSTRPFDGTQSWMLISGRWHTNTPMPFDPIMCNYVSMASSHSSCGKLATWIVLELPNPPAKGAVCAAAESTARAASKHDPASGFEEPG
jgi:hypothetical protein